MKLSECEKRAVLAIREATMAMLPEGVKIGTFCGMPHIKLKRPMVFVQKSGIAVTYGDDDSMQAAEGVLTWAELFRQAEEEHESDVRETLRLFERASKRLRAILKRKESGSAVRDPLSPTESERIRASQPAERNATSEHRLSDAGPAGVQTAVVRSPYGAGPGSNEREGVN